jgi:hypothetical protein
MTRQSGYNGSQEYKKIFCPNHTIDFLKKLIEKKQSCPAKSSILKSDMCGKKRLSKNLSPIKVFTKKAEFDKGDLAYNDITKAVKEENNFEELKQAEEIMFIDLIKEEFNDYESKFYSFMEEDMKRVAQQKTSLLTISSFKRINDFISINLDYLFK